MVGSLEFCTGKCLGYDRLKGSLLWMGNMRFAPLRKRFAHSYHSGSDSPMFILQFMFHPNWREMDFVPCRVWDGFSSFMASAWMGSREREVVFFSGCRFRSLQE